MLVSETFCENNLQLLFTVLDKSTDPTVRANTIIAAGKDSNVYFWDLFALIENIQNIFSIDTLISNFNPIFR